MDSTLKTKLNAIQSKAVPVGKSAVTDPVHYLDPAEFNTVVDAVKANNTDIEAAQSDISTLQSEVATLQSNPVSSKGPKVVSTDPGNNAVNVLSTKVITVTVDQFLYASSVNNTNITLKDKDGNAVAITVSYDGAKTITINHASAFSIPASPYAVHIGTGVLNVLGEAFNNNAEYILGFSCGTDNFPSKPVITYDNVTYNSARINLLTPSTDDMGSVSYILAYGDGTEISNPVTLPYTFSTLLNPNADYTVKLGAKDSAGQVTWSDSITFHTLANQAPTATNVSISGNVTQGSVLTGNYTYSDAEGNTEGATTFRWLRNGVAIAGATAKTYTITSNDLSTVITFEVTPIATSGTTTGSPSTAQVSIPGTEWLQELSAQANPTYSKAAIVSSALNLSVRALTAVTTTVDLKSTRTFDFSSGKKYIEGTFDESLTSPCYSVSFGLMGAATIIRMLSLYGAGSLRLMGWSPSGGEQYTTDAAIASASLGTHTWKLEIDPSTKVVKAYRDGVLKQSVTLSGTPDLSNLNLYLAVETQSTTTTVTRAFDNIKVYDADGTTVLFQEDFTTQKW